MYEKSLLYKVTWYYYINNMTQEAIAKHLNISRSRVVKLLSKAKMDGLVKFKIDHQTLDKINLENAILEKYKLNDIFIIPSTPCNLKDSLAKGAAKYINSKVEEDAFINIGYGETVSKTVVELVNSGQKQLSLVTLSGGVSNYTSSIISGVHKSSSVTPTPNFYVVPSPLIVSTKEIADAFLKEKEVKSILNMSKFSNMTLIGIGAVNEEATIFKTNIVDKNNLTILKMKGAVGDVLSQFYDKNGDLIDTVLHSKLVSVKIENLRNSDNVIAVAGGKNKIEAIDAALKGKFINILITDEDTGKALLERD
ncbi:sugar-binding transcriptional regulator [Oceanivirga salmonicida]|uniref:sugar-binding transcriptional regulator n=1 Tax=Oceanivirga salmonicida TaxID=1769291 RepID=UPI0012E2E9F8|nr:sugar-binding domain-containing protein [Oceanivirga salmonicida]